ncbi:MAG TPA: PEP/pyruvate-binding domain-containing protein [Candidatus Limnocylindrales bacterium]|nr:PEP/pyruvate-binding domain-containing protein [Candidatus Limnocylindrales bacterium]
MYIKAFQQVSMFDVAVVGGKGASLGEMTKAGIQVPNGFVITTNAFKDFSKNEVSTLFKDELIKAFDQLGTKRVAVRSSAIAEDSSSASWAGQLESYLNVAQENLLDSIIKCWDSINSERVKNYALQNKVPSSQLVVAVIVQKMVDSEVSGVMFTVNPVTNNKDEIMIEAGYGLGELIVQGEIIPDNYLINKIKLSITESTQGSQEIMLIYQNGENEKIRVPDNLKSKPALNTSQIIELAKLGKRIEDHYNSPQDIEWAMEDNKFYIVQSRPITTL